MNECVNYYGQKSPLTIDEGSGGTMGETLIYALRQHLAGIERKKDGSDNYNTTIIKAAEYVMYNNKITLLLSI